MRNPSLGSGEKAAAPVVVRSGRSFVGRSLRHVCPTCGQRVLIRHGAKLYPKWADIYDAIAIHEKNGILGEQLIWMFWPNTPKKQAQNVLHQTIHQINVLIAPAGFKIGAGGKGLPYRVWPIPKFTSGKGWSRD